MLVRAYGVPPTEFEWTLRNKAGEVISTKSYTPQSFYKEYFGDIDLENDFVMVMNDPSREYYKVYEIEYDRHVYDGDNWLYLNLPIEEVKALAIASIKDNTAMYFSCDVGKYLNRDKGTLDINNFDYESLMGVEFPMNKEERIRTFASGSSHAMTLIAVDLDEAGNPKKWMVENSWGAKSGWRGNLIMTDEWFEEYMFRVVVDKKYIPAETLKLLEQKPQMLPSWDPMFAYEE
jgi:bleomycin hydrolase